MLKNSASKSFLKFSSETSSEEPQWIVRKEKTASPELVSGAQLRLSPRKLSSPSTTKPANHSSNSSIKQYLVHSKLKEKYDHNKNKGMISESPLVKNRLIPQVEVQKEDDQEVSKKDSIADDQNNRDMEGKSTPSKQTSLTSVGSVVKVQNTFSQQTVKKRLTFEQNLERMFSKKKQLDLSTFITGVKPVSSLAKLITGEGVYAQKIPKEIKPSMVMIVKPFSIPNIDPSTFVYIETNDIKSELDSITDSFDAIVMDPPWFLDSNCSDTSCDLITPEQLATWNITDGLITHGFLFVWTEKELISKVVIMAEKWKFSYVENVVWVKQNVNNTVVKDSYKYFRKSSMTMLIFKKENKKDSTT